MIQQGSNGLKGAQVRATGHKGFTLIEVMIVVAIVAILTTIALPSYQSYIRRAARTAGMNYVADIAQRQELRFQNTRAYSSALTDFPAMPADASQNYAAPVIVLDAGPPAGFTITMSPLASGILSADGDLVISSTGTRTRGGKGWDER